MNLNSDSLDVARLVVWLSRPLAFKTEPTGQTHFYAIPLIYCCIEYCVIKVDADMLYCHFEFRLEYQIDSLQYFMYSFAYKFTFKASFETLNLPKTTKATN